MGLVDSFSEPPKTRRGPICGIGLLLPQLSKEDRAALEAAMAAPMNVWPHTEITKALKRNGIENISSDTVAHHRNNICKCHSLTT